MSGHTTKRYRTLIGQGAVSALLAMSLACSGAQKKGDMADRGKPAGKPAAVQPAASGSVAKQVDTLVKDSRKQLGKDRFAEARELARRAEALQPGDKKVADLLKSIDEGEKEFNMKGQADKINSAIADGRKALKSDLFDQARRSGEQALALDPNNAKAKSLMTDIGVAEKKAEAKRAREVVSRHISASEKAIDSKQFDEARKQLAEAKSAAKGNPEFTKDLELLDKEISEQEARSKSTASKDQVGTHIAAARKDIKAGNYEKARTSLDKAYELDKSNKDVVALRKELTEAEQGAKAGEKSRMAEQSVEAGDRALKSKNYDEAAASYKKALAEDPKNSAATKGLAAVESARAGEKSAKAGELVKKAESQSKAGNYEAALATLDEARKLDPNSKDVAEATADTRKAMTASTAKPVETAEAKPKPTPTPVATPTPAPTPKPEPAKAEPAKTEPAKAEPAKSEPAKSEPAKAEPKKAEPAKAEPAKTASAAEKASKEGFDKAMKRADQLVEAGQYDAAVAAYDSAAREFPQYAADADKARQSAMKSGEQTKAAEAEKSNKAKRKKAEELFQEGLAVYDKEGARTLASLQQARDKWTQSLELDPSYEQPRVYLLDTEPAFNELMSKKQKEEDFASRERAAKDKMETPIPIETIVPTDLAEFLRTLKLLSGMDFVLVGVQGATIQASFQDKPLREVLDSVLLPIGLKWERKPGEDVVIITPDLRTRVFPVTPEKLSTIDALLENGTLQKLLYAPLGKPTLQGQEVYTDGRQNVVVITDSAANLQKFDEMVRNLRSDETVGLIFRSYEIDEKQGAQVKALLEAILRADDQAPYNPERKLILEGGTLIIKDTAENIRRVEEVLQDRKIIGGLYDNTLGVRTFNLTPVLEIEANPELAREFGENIVTIVQTLLYAQEGVSKAQSEGRRLWYDPATLQLTVTDYPDRLDAVEEFIESLPQIRRRTRSKIIFLDWADASDLSSQLDTFLGGGVGASADTATGNEVTKTLRVEGELEFNGGFFRVTRVNENDVDDDNDDDVELVVRTGTTSQDVTIEEFRSEFVEDFEIVAEDITPSSTPGEGRAKLTFRFVPGGDSGAEVTPEATPILTPEEEADQLGVTVEAVPNLNAMWVQYDNANDLKEVEFWIDTLDKPTLQVSLEIKFVEVAESKARELKSDFTIGNLADGIDLSDDVIRSRFAQTIDEFRDPFEAPIEATQSANLLKGATVTSWIVNNGQSPISLTLRALEAQGIINVVNAPSITVLNGQDATFDITREFGIRTPIAGATGGDGDQGNFQAVPSLQAVQMEATPTVTQAGNITLDPLSVEIRDFDHNIGSPFAIVDGDDDADLVTGGFTTTAVTNTPGNFGVLVKEIDTVVRLRDGGTVVLGGWRNERTQELESGIPILRDIPFVGKFLFNRSQDTSDRITLLIFLTGSVVRD